MSGMCWPVEGVKVDLDAGEIVEKAFSELLARVSVSISLDSSDFFVLPEREKEAAKVRGQIGMVLADYSDDGEDWLDDEQPFLGTLQHAISEAIRKDAYLYEGEQSFEQIRNKWICALHTLADNLLGLDPAP